MALPARALIFSLGIRSLRPGRPQPCTEAAIPSPRSGLGFRGLYVLVHVIRLPVILIWTSCRGGRCFSWDLLCGPAGRQSDGSQWIHPALFPQPECPPWGSNPQRPQNSLKEKAALDGVSVLALGFDRDLSYLGSRKSVTPFMQLDGQPAQEDPTTRGHGC